MSNATPRAFEPEWITYLFLSQDKAGIDEWMAFVENPKLNDIHRRNEIDFRLPERRIAKFFLFRAIYKGPAFAYANDPDFMHVSTSERFWQGVIDRFYDKYRGLAKKHTEYIRTVTTTGHLITPFGRTYEFQRNKRNQWPESDICNWPNQGTGADVMAVARVLFANRFRRSKLEGKLISTVHDSIVVDCPDSSVVPVAQLMHGVFADLPEWISKMYEVDWNLPLLCEASAGPNMKELEEIKLS